MSDSTKEFYLPDPSDMSPVSLDSRSGLDSQDHRDAIAELNADIAWDEMTRGVADERAQGAMANSYMRPRVGFTRTQIAAYMLERLRLL